MNKTAAKAAMLFLFVCSVIKINAQTNAGKWQLGINGGVFIYQGDLTPSSFGSYKTPSLALGINVSRILNSYFAVRANLALGKLRGNDAAYSEPAWRQQRNLNFSTPVTELSVLMLWNLFGNNNNELGRRFSPYLFAGAGINKISISRDYSKLDRSVFANGSKVQLGLAVDSLKTLSRTIAVLPVGAGLEYYISPKISLSFETNFCYTFTDYLDGFSYVAEPNKKDFYHSQTLGFIFRFGKKDQLGCPVLKF